MKKNRLVLLGLIILSVFLSSCTGSNKEGVAATVFGKDILVSEVKQTQEYYNFVYEQNIRYINDLQIADDSKKELLGTVSAPKTYDEILDEKIEFAVLLHEAEKKNLKVDFSECENEAEKVYNQLKSVSVDDYENYQTYLLIKNYIEFYGCSEDEYVKILASKYYDNHKINLLKDYFKNNLYTPSEKTFEIQYSEYVQKLVENATVVYYD